MIKTIIADDEIHARDRLKDLLAEFDCFEIVGEAEDGNQALNLMIAQSPDVAFLDINMPGMSVFQSVPSLSNPPLIVFQTAYSEHAVDAFAIDALDYLLKPIRRERLEQTVQKIREKLNNAQKTPAENAESSNKSEDRISVKVNGKITLIPIKDIVRISLENGFCCIYTTNEKCLSDKYLNFYEEKLSDKNFFRTSRTDIVNLNAISSIQTPSSDSCIVELSNGTHVDVSRRKTQELKKLIQL